MCVDNYQDKCYTGCNLYGKCNNHKLYVCDKCGKRIKPGNLILVRGEFFACSKECEEFLEKRLSITWFNLGETFKEVRPNVS